MIQRAHKRAGDHDQKMSVDGPATAGRRGVLTFLSVGGMALVGGLAGVFQTAEPASAGLASPCCSLASNTRCSGRCHNYTCPSGYYKRYWWCTAGVRPIGCGECQKGSGTCWEGTSFACSTWWDDNAC
ncbi:hypothetical protein QLQ12_32650 [Actinoplanes sp. NEAU-A12]|uniref:Twin-arginine translocation signal domain-containing protein n=1 Tax=Actinoplanes sandaracinus TaxID=3045177 RepID=A0ABT6WUS4_9ACTN|nr:hypothetical protein [Actinoplanes sandaracinus]MDI6103370.1 hypothetical protein [Actinoplanes sandaracinus]